GPHLSTVTQARQGPGRVFGHCGPASSLRPASGLIALRSQSAPPARHARHRQADLRSFRSPPLPLGRGHARWLEETDCRPDLGLAEPNLLPFQGWIVLTESDAVAARDGGGGKRVVSLRCSRPRSRPLKAKPSVRVSNARSSAPGALAGSATAACRRGIRS